MLRLFFLLLPFLLTHASFSNLFHLRDTDFCLGHESTTPPSPEPDLDCARTCLQSPSTCCGFSFPPCRLLTNVRSDLTPRNASSGRCQIYMRQACRACPTVFNATFPLAPKRAFALSGEAVVSGSARSHCEALGGRVLEGRPSRLMVDLAQEVRAIWETRNKTGICLIKNGDYKCRFSLGADMRNDGNFYWRSNGEKVDLDNLAVLGFPFNSADGGDILNLALPLPLDPAIKVSFSFLTQTLRNTSQVALCECQFLP